MKLTQFDFNKMVTLNGNEVMTTSLKVAEYFGKKHKDVLKKIRNTIKDCEDEEYTQRIFAPFDFIDKNGEVQPAFNLTRNGFMLLVMGFTGKYALKIKIKYMQVFDWMSLQLSNRYSVIEKMMHEHDTKELLSKCRGSIGSKLMNDRKREKKVLTIEYENLLAISQQEMKFILAA